MKIKLNITSGCQYHDKIYNDKNDNFAPFKLITLKIPIDLLQDCYSYSAMDAPSELKSLIMEEIGLLFDKIVLDGCSTHCEKKDLMKKLNRIEVRYKEDV